jgi:hypothetical protein
MVAILTLLGVGAAFGETRLAGVSIGQSPRSLMDLKAYGSPNGMITAPLTFNPMAPLGLPVAGYSALPNYARAVAPTTLTAGQVEWVYNRGDLALGFVVSGMGTDAQISDIIVSIWNQQPRRTPPIRTELGIGLGDSFRSVLLRYGWPPLVQTLHVMRATTPGALPTPQMMLPPASLPTTGVTSLPPVTIGTGGEAMATVGLAARSFTRHCVLGYPGVTFTLYRMKVVRIQIYEPTAPAPTAPNAPNVAMPNAPGMPPGMPTAPQPPAGGMTNEERDRLER